ncbi:MAG TPA: molybdopterin-binding protein [Chloroflexota bacterium]|nr:molybdopterin-binding protein [Chloroflexota bacterium]
MSNTHSTGQAHSSGTEIVSIGTELLLGRIQDTNSFWLAEQIADLGGSVSRITVVGDDQATIVDAVESATGDSSLSLRGRYPGDCRRAWRSNPRSRSRPQIPWVSSPAPFAVFVYLV